MLYYTILPLLLLIYFLKHVVYAGMSIGICRISRIQIRHIQSSAYTKWFCRSLAMSYMPYTAVCDCYFWLTFQKMSYMPECQWKFVVYRESRSGIYNMILPVPCDVVYAGYYCTAYATWFCRSLAMSYMPDTTVLIYKSIVENIGPAWLVPVLQVASRLKNWLCLP